MRLGEMLVRDGRLTPRQVEQALAHQAKVGGRLGTVLVELKMLDPDTLTVYLGLELGIPIATRAAMERAKKAAVRLLTPDQAMKFHAIPLVSQDRQLIVAMRDPHDLLLLDDLGAATGYRIVPRIAAETRMYFYLEKYYGLRRPERFSRMSDEWAVHARPDENAFEPPAPPLPGLPPRVASPVSTPFPVPPTVRPLAAGARPRPEEDYDELALVLDEDKSEPAASLSHGSRTTRPPTPPPPPRMPPPAEAADKTEQLDFEATLARMSAANSRGEVANALIGYARGILDAAALLVVREGLAIGWRGFGKKVDRDRIETIMIPLEAPSIFRGSVEHDVVYAGPAAPSALHQHLFKILRTEPPRQAIVAPIFIGNRVVNLLYGHREGDHWLDDKALDGLRNVTRAAAEAYVRLIALHKQHPSG